MAQVRNLDGHRNRLGGLLPVLIAAAVALMAGFMLGGVMSKPSEIPQPQRANVNLLQAASILPATESEASNFATECPTCPELVPEPCPEPLHKEPDSISTEGTKQAMATTLPDEKAAAVQPNHIDVSDPRIKAILEYPFKMHPRALRRSIFSPGEMSRMRRFLNKLLSGQPVTVAGVGGSVTAGQGTSDGHGFFLRFQEFINGTFPNRKHKFVNLAFGGSTNQIFTMCIHTFLKDADFAIVEFTMNDRSPEIERLDREVDVNNVKAIPLTKSYERLIRKLYNLPSNPAVVLMHHYAWFPTQGVYELPPEVIPHGPTEWKEKSDKKTDIRGAYYDSPESIYTPIGSYYGLPQLSVRHTAYRLMLEGIPGYHVHVWSHEHPGTNEDELFYFDNVHPNSRTGSLVMAEMLINLMRTTALDLQTNPYTPEDDAIAKEALPPPMIFGNWEKVGSTCLLGEEIQTSVVQQSGDWQLINEQKPNGRTQKWGLIASKPGAWTILKIDSRSVDRKEVAQTVEDAKSLLPPNDVVISFLRSYEHMGKFKVECVSGCNCTAVEANGHNKEEKVSISDMIRIPAAQHPECQVKITILEATSSGEHKVKLIGLMMLENNAVYDARGITIDVLLRKADERASQQASIEGTA